MLIENIRIFIINNLWEQAVPEIFSELIIARNKTINFLSSPSPSHHPVSGYSGDGGYWSFIAFHHRFFDAARKSPVAVPTLPSYQTQNQWIKH